MRDTIFLAKNIKDYEKWQKEVQKYIFSKLNISWSSGAKEIHIKHYPIYFHIVNNRLYYGDMAFVDSQELENLNNNCIIIDYNFKINGIEIE